MDIAFVVDEYYGHTGVSTHARDLAGNLAKQNVRATVFASDVQANERIANPRFVRVLDWPLIPQPLSVFFQLIIEHRRTPFSVVHVHDSIAFLGVYPFARLHRIPVVFTVQASIFSPGREKDYPAYARLVFKFTNRYVAKKARILLCISQEMISCMNYAGASMDRIIYQPNPIRSSFFQPNISDREDSGIKRCLFVGQLRPTKGVEFLIRAVPMIINRFPETSFTIAGDGPLKNVLSTLSSELGVSDKVQFVGHVPYSEINNYYRRSTIFVFPSLNEPMGLALVEALASGLPVVASRVGGIPEWVEDGYNGFLVEPGNSEQLGYAISQLLENEHRRNTFARNAVETVKELSWDKAISRYISLYSELCRLG